MYNPNIGLPLYMLTPPDDPNEDFDEAVSERAEELLKELPQWAFEVCPDDWTDEMNEELPEWVDCDDIKACALCEAERQIKQEDAWAEADKYDRREAA